MEEERQWEATQNGDGVGIIEVKLVPKKNLITLVGMVS